MKRLAWIAAALALVAGTVAAETSQQKKDHEVACVAGTVTGALLGAAVGGLFGNGAGKDMMRAAGSATGALVGNNYACKKHS
jgi:uncharacterized protein YcfJ